MTHFDPFQNRLCRNIRNELSGSLIAAIRTMDMAPAYAVATAYLAVDAQPHINGYINKRMVRYHAVLNRIQTAALFPGDIYAIGLLLWNRHLFFEVHEWFEKKWLNSVGAEKQLLQALIRAAGVYHLLEHGRQAGAERLAAKAADGLIRHKDVCSVSMDLDLLIATLDPLDPMPPMLGPR